ncbi:branched-chain amino acid ABC transporter permease [Bradyrhizobium sp.]|uniref:branched-chain amino acid ABC transporter permease n=1 Tax=Bradyrhizobium sp. TaxID=376 RepID=UPI0039E5D76F
MQLLPSQIFNGIGLGLVYFLIAVGMTLIVGIMGIVNFTHGAFVLLGCYFSYQIVQIAHSFWYALLLAPLLVGGMAFIVERVLLSRLYGASHLDQILATLGLSIIIVELVIACWGEYALPVGVPPALSGAAVLWSDFSYPRYRLFLLAFSSVTALTLWLALERTTYGAIIRAGSQSKTMVELLGVNIGLLYSATFALGAALAGLAGVLFAPLRGASTSVALEALGISFVIVVLGGMGNFTGALLGALLVGLTQSITSAYYPAVSEAMIYVSMAVVLLLRPHGLLGRS